MKHLIDDRLTDSLLVEIAIVASCRSWLNPAMIKLALDLVLDPNIID